MFTNKITLSNMPQALAYLISKAERIETLPEAKMSGPPLPDKWLNLHELCNYLPDKPAAQTVYWWISKKRLFLQSEIDAWLKTGTMDTDCKTGVEANECVTNQGRAKL